MLSLLKLERKQKSSSEPFRIRIYLFLSYSFRNETINTLIHSVVPSKTILDSRPKWAKCIPVFRPKRSVNPTRWGGTDTYMAYIREYPPGLSFGLVNEGLIARVRFVLHFKVATFYFNPQHSIEFSHLGVPSQMFLEACIAKSVSASCLNRLLQR